MEVGEMVPMNFGQNAIEKYSQNGYKIATLTHVKNVNIAKKLFFKIG